MRTAVLGAAWASRLVPWVVVVPLVIALGAMLAAPQSMMRTVGAVGVVGTLAILVMPVLTALMPANRAWLQRTVVVGPDSLVVAMPGREPMEVGFSEIGQTRTGTLLLGMPLPPTFQLLTEFRHIDGHRLSELALQHYDYRYGWRLTDFNRDSVVLLAALLDTPAAGSLDLASRTLVDLVMHDPDEALPPAAARALRAGRLHAAQRRLRWTARRTKHVSHALVRLEYLLASRSLATAKKAYDEKPRDPLVRYYLAHALLASIPSSPEHRERVISSRARRRNEAAALLRSVRKSAVWGPWAELDLAEIGARMRVPAHRRGLRRVLQYRARRRRGTRAPRR